MADERTKEQVKEETKEQNTETVDTQSTDEAAKAFAEQLEAAQEEKQTLADEIKALRADFKEQHDKSKSALEPIDDALVDPKVIRNLEKLNTQYKEVTAKLKQQEEIIGQYQAKEQERARAEQIKRVTEEILTPLDGIYGAKYRAAAIALADKKVKDGNIEAPADPLKGYLLMEKCYKELKAKDDTAASEKKNTATDSGFGGVAFDDAKVTTGDRLSILEDIKKHGLRGVKPINT